MRLSALGVPATFINSTLEAKKWNSACRAAMQGKYKLLYIAPERLESDWFRARDGGVESSACCD